MNDIILIVLLICGKPDGFIVKVHEKQAVVTYQVNDIDVLENIAKLLKSKPTIIVYEDKRSVCI